MLEVKQLRWRRACNFELAVETFEVGGGRVALIGGNGSGKSSLLELLAGLHTPDAGRINLFGDKAPTALDRETRPKLGVQTPAAAYNPVLKVRDLADLHASVYGPADPRVLQALEIDELRNHMVPALSQGQRRRLDLHLALAHRPRLVLLDEPTAGLDAARVTALLDLCDALATDGATIISATHDELELNRSKRVLWLEAGTIRADSTPAALLETLVGTHRAELKFDGASPPAPESALALGAAHARLHRGTLQVSGGMQTRQILDELIARFKPTFWSFGATGWGDLLEAVTERSASQ